MDTGEGGRPGHGEGDKVLPLRAQRPRLCPLPTAASCPLLQPLWRGAGCAPLHCGLRAPYPRYLQAQSWLYSLTKVPFVTTPHCPVTQGHLLHGSPDPEVVFLFLPTGVRVPRQGEFHRSLTSGKWEPRIC